MMYKKTRERARKEKEMKGEDKKEEKSTIQEKMK